MRFHSIFHFSILKTSLTLWRQQFRNQYSYQTSKLKQKSWITNEGIKRDVPFKCTVIWIQITIKRFSLIIRMHHWAHRMSYSSSEILQLHNSLFVQVQLFQYFRHSSNMEEKKNHTSINNYVKKIYSAKKNAWERNNDAYEILSILLYTILVLFLLLFFSKCHLIRVL